MERRRFFGVTAAAVAAEILAHPSLRAADSAQDWRPDGVGSIARIGVLTPAFDPVPESEAWAMAPQGVSIHASRMRWKRGDPRSAESPQIDAAVELLAEVKPRAIMYGFTSSSYVLGTAGDEVFRTRLEKVAAGIPVILAAQAASAALRAVNARRVAIVHPPWFSEEVSDKGRAYFEGLGFVVVSCSRLLPLRDLQEELAPAAVYDRVSTMVPKEADAVLIAGNGLRAVGIIHALEEHLRRPVLTANQVTFWAALKTVISAPQITQFGRLFRVAQQ